MNSSSRCGLWAYLVIGETEIEAILKGDANLFLVRSVQCLLYAWTCRLREIGAEGLAKRWGDDLGNAGTQAVTYMQYVIRIDATNRIVSLCNFDVFQMRMRMRNGR